MMFLCIRKVNIFFIKLQLNNNLKIVLEMELLLVIILIDFNYRLFSQAIKKHLNMTSKIIKENWIEK